MEKQSFKKIASYFTVCSMLTFFGVFAFSSDIKSLQATMSKKIKKSVVDSKLDDIQRNLACMTTAYVSCGACMGSSDDANPLTNLALKANIIATTKTSQRCLDKISKNLRFLCIPADVIHSYEHHSKKFLEASVDYGLAINAPGGLDNGQEKLFACEMDNHAKKISTIFSEIIGSKKVGEPWVEISQQIQNGAKYYRLAHNLSQQGSPDAEKMAEKAVACSNTCLKLHRTYFHQIKKFSPYEFVCDNQKSEPFLSSH